MDSGRRSALAGGIILILLGLLFLAGQLGWLNWAGPLTWPLILVGVGGFLLILGLLVGAPGMAVPACIVAGIGLILYWQNATGRWDTWAYMWTLIPGFVGVGTILTGLLEGKWDTIRGGLWLMVISAILYGIFASVFGGVTILGKWWPVLLILLGVVSLLEVLFRPRRERPKDIAGTSSGQDQ